MGFHYVFAGLTSAYTAEGQIQCPKRVQCSTFSSIIASILYPHGQGAGPLSVIVRVTNDRT